jgi:hypothetical protein
MNRRLALSLLLTTSIVLAVLLLLDVITPLLSGIIFAVALVLFGALSRGYRK